MKKLLLLACIFFLHTHSFAQNSVQQTETLSYIFSKLSNYTTQINLSKDPGYYILFEPKIASWEETLNFETSDKSVSIPMDAVTVSTVQDYGVILTGGNLGEATLFMDVDAEPGLREKLQAALNEYLENKKTKNYTVYENTGW